MIADNCSTMVKLARDCLECPMIGCYSHKLNLAVKNWLGLNYTSTHSNNYANRSEEQLVVIVREICIKLRTMLNSANLRELLLRDEFLAVLLMVQKTR